MKKGILSLLLLILVSSLNLEAQNAIKVLFIGNSYTASNDLGSLVSQIADSKGNSVIYQQHAPGGMTFQGHATNQSTYDAMHADQWDYIVLQAQSQEPSFPPSQVAIETYPYAKILVDSVKAIHPCAEPVFFMTWGRKNGDPVNGSVYPVIATYDGMQMRLRQSYMEMAEDNDCTVAPVGVAWKWMRDNHPNVELYAGDESHPGINGSYLAACVFYATFFEDTPLGSTFTPTSVNLTNAAYMQEAANNIVIDSLDTWRIGANLPFADFSYVLNNNEVSFEPVDQGNNLVDFYWDFGDGKNDTIEAPVHVYDTLGFYDVSLKAKTSCATDAIIKQIEISSMLKLEEPDNSSISVYPNPVSQILNVMFDNEQVRQIKILDIHGKCVFSGTSKGNQYECDMSGLSSGIYFLEVSAESAPVYIRLLKE